MVVLLNVHTNWFSSLLQLILFTGCRVHTLVCLAFSEEHERTDPVTAMKY